MVTHHAPAEATAGPLAGLLRGLRERALLTQEELAQRAGLSTGSVRGLEAGRVRRPRGASIRLLAEALGLTKEERELLAAAARGEAVELGAAEPGTRGPVHEAVVPAELPAIAAGFTGRDLEFEALDGLLPAGSGTPAGAVAIVVVEGMAGVGKTALATCWAHRVAGRFPDGQLFVNLRGYADAPPLRPIDALAALLRSLGTPPERVPLETEEAAAALRSLLAGRRVLLVLDNAASAEQVRPLLPGSPGCLVVVTSRNRLTGLAAREGARRLTLGALAAGEASALLGQLLGPDRAGAEPRAVAELASVCAYLPLALRIAAATLADHPHRTVAAHVAELGQGSPLAGLAVDGDADSAVRAAFDSSYRALPAPARRLFRLLCLVPGPDVTPAAAAALTATTPDLARGLLDRLAGSHLVFEQARERYAMHDLLRAYARERAEREADGRVDPAEARAVATERLLGWYLAAAEAAADLLYPEMLRLPVPPPDPTLPDAGFDDDHAAALAWLDGERPNLIAATRHAADHGPHRWAWQLAGAIRGYLWHRRLAVDWHTALDAALAAATADQDRHAQAAAHIGLGDLHLATSGYPQATRHYDAALELARGAGWTAGVASALGNLGIVHRELGQLQAAADHLAQGVALMRRAGPDRVGGHASGLAKLGVIYRELGRLQLAADHLAQAVPLFRRASSLGGEAHALGNLGQVNHDLGDYGDAGAYLARALTLYQQVGDRYGEANALHALAALNRDAGRGAEALRQARASVALADTLGDHHTKADALDTLGRVELRLGKPSQALERHREAFNLASRSGARVQQASALLGLAEAAIGQGRHATALQHAERALTLTRDGDYRLLEGHVRTVLATALLALGRTVQAVETGRDALALQRDTGHYLGQVRSLVVLGRALERAGEVARARTCWREALTLITDVGAGASGPELEEVRGLLGADASADGGPG